MHHPWTCSKAIDTQVNEALLLLKASFIDVINQIKGLVTLCFDATLPNYAQAWRVTVTVEKVETQVYSCTYTKLFSNQPVCETILDTYLHAFEI